ncbi:MAG: WD40/YVTN/BNR-like repeat-containing protein [Psychrobium sp.]
MFKTKPLIVACAIAGLTSTWTLASHANDNKKIKQVFTSQPAVLAASAPVMAIANNGQQMIAVGDRGHVLTKNAQSDWQQVIIPTDVLLTDVEFSGSNFGWSVGHDATIIHTIDSGKSWTIQQQFPELDRPLLDVMFTSDDNGYAIGAYGMFFATKDGGKSWNKQFLSSLLPQEDVEYLAEVREESEEDYQFEIASILPHFNKIIELSNKRMMLVGELGLIAFSADQGATWQRIDNVYEGSFFSAMQSQSGAILVGGLRGHMFRSTDGGVNWQQIDLGNNNSVNDVYQLANGDILVAQNNGVILRSTDDGKSFSQDSVRKGEDLMDIRQFEDQVWLAGSKGLHLLEGEK